MVSGCRWVSQIFPALISNGDSLWCAMSLKFFPTINSCYGRTGGHTPCFFGSDQVISDQTSVMFTQNQGRKRDICEWPVSCPASAASWAQAASTWSEGERHNQDCRVEGHGRPRVRWDYRENCGVQPGQVWDSSRDFNRNCDQIRTEMKSLKEFYLTQV